MDIFEIQGWSIDNFTKSIHINRTVKEFLIFPTHIFFPKMDIQVMELHFRIEWKFRSYFVYPLFPYKTCLWLTSQICVITPLN